MIIENVNQLNLMTQKVRASLIPVGQDTCIQPLQVAMASSKHILSGSSGL